jgi:hypothetical protein
MGLRREKDAMMRVSVQVLHQDFFYQARLSGPRRPLDRQDILKPQGPRQDFPLFGIERTSGDVQIRDACRGPGRCGFDDDGF